MFDEEFYSTPEHLIRKMLEPYLKEGRLPRMTVLEPSAGKGDIADYVQKVMYGPTYYGRTRETDNIYCIERNPDLQAVLRNKGYTVLCDDFLHYAGQGVLFDLIIMNPPFSKGSAHLLHAWNIMRSGEVVCILPTETLKNPYSKERELLSSIIADNNGVIEEEGQAFRQAERKTDVEVCIIRIKKQDDSFMDGVFNGADFTKTNPFAGETPLINENQIACRNTIRRMVEAYKATLDSFAGAVKGIRELDFYGREFGDRYDANDKYGNKACRGVVEAFCQIIQRGFVGDTEKEKFVKGYRESFNIFAASVRRAAWDTVFDKTEMSRLMTKGVQEEFQKLQKENTSIEFTEGNVANLLETLLMSGDTIREGAILEAFDLMTKYHKENRVHWEGWKTNDYWRVNRRFILPSVLDSSWGQAWHITHTRNQGLDDIDRGLCLLEGLRYDQIVTITGAIESAYKQDKTYGEKIESHFFEIRGYKKGTAHFHFKDKNLWERFNVAACKGKNWLPVSSV